MGLKIRICLILMICTVVLGQSSSIGIAKNATITGREVVFDFYLENLGDDNLNTISMNDDLDIVFGAGNYTVISTPHFIINPGTIELNMAFDGSTHTELISSGTLDIGVLAQIQITISVDNFIDLGYGLGIYYNQVIASGFDYFGYLISDLSDNGTDPDPDGNGDANEAGENDPTFMNFFETPVIGVSKNVSVSGSFVTMNFYLENLGNVTIQSLSLPDNLDNVFGAGNYTIVSSPYFTNDPGTITLNAGYTGSPPNTGIISSGSLGVGETATIRVEVQVSTLTDQGLGLGIYTNQVLFGGQSPSGKSVVDISDNGIDPDPNGNGNPNEAGENDPTPIIIGLDSKIGVAKDVAVNGSEVTFLFSFENYGNNSFYNLSLHDDMDTVFGPGNYSVASEPILIDDPGTITINASYNGSTDKELIQNGTLGEGDTATIQLVIYVTLISDQGMGTGSYINQVTISALDSGGSLTWDLSDEGTNPDPNGNGDPNEAGENDPTSIEITGESAIGIAKNITVDTTHVTFDFYLENLGNVDLGNISLHDDLDSVFGSGNYFITSGPTFIDDPGSISLNAGFDGSSDTSLISSGLLNSSTTAGIRFTVKVTSLIDQGAGEGIYSNQVIISGDDYLGNTINDISNDGTIPDPNGNGIANEAGENTPSVFTILPYPVVGIAKNATITGSIVTFDFYIKNYGNTNLILDTIEDDLELTFGSGNFHIVDPPVLINDPGTITLNTAYDGTPPEINLITSGTLSAGDTARIQMDVEVTHIADRGFGVGWYENQAFIKGRSQGNINTSDLSTQGIEPDPNNNGNPTESEENIKTSFFINSPPVITPGPSLTISEIDPPSLIAPSLTLSDPNDTFMLSAMVSIAAGRTEGDVLGFTSAGNIDSSYDPASCILLFSGEDTISNYQDLLASVTFQTTSNNPTAISSSRTIKYSITDSFDGESGVRTGTAESNIQIIPVNNPPVISGGSTLNYLETNPPCPIDPNVTLSDPDDSHLREAVIRITSGFSSGDILSVPSISGIISNYNSSTGTLTLTGTEPLTTYQNALRQVSYSSSSGIPSTPYGTRTIEFKVTDANQAGVGSKTGILQNSIKITPVNQPPIVTFNSNLIYIENAPPQIIDSSIIISDPDDTHITHASIQILDGFTSGDTLYFSSTGIITGNYNHLTGTLMLTGNDSLTEYENILRSIAFSSTSENPTSLSNTRTIRIEIFDGDNEGLGSESGYASGSINIVEIDEGEISLLHNGHVWNSGESYSYGTIEVNSTSQTKFIIKNLDTGVLELTTPLTISGSDSSHFYIVSQPTSNICPNGCSVSMSIAFTPLSEGSKTAHVLIESNDADENPFEIILNGNGINPPVISGNTGEAGVKIEDQSGHLPPVLSDEYGNYSFTVPYLWEGTLYPSKTGYSFTPASRSYTLVAEDISGQNFNASIDTFVISSTSGSNGTVSPPGDTIVEYGSSLIVKFLPDIGYITDTAYLDDSPINHKHYYPFRQITSDHSLHVTFKKDMAPVIEEFIIEPKSGFSPLGTNMKVIAYDPDGSDIVRFYWDFNTDGVIDEVTDSPSLSHMYYFKGDYIPSVTVEDNQGNQVTMTGNTVIVSEPYPLMIPLEILSKKFDTTLSHQIFNLSNEDNIITLEGIDESFKYTEKIRLTLPSNGAAEINSMLFSNPDIAYIKICSSNHSKVLCVLDDGKQLETAIYPIPLSSQAYITHIPDNMMADWYGSLFLTSYQPCQLHLSLCQKGYNLNHNLFSWINFNDFNISHNSEECWGQLKVIDPSPNLMDTKIISGFMIFQNRDYDGAMVPLPSTAGQNFYIPHIPSENTPFWAGLAILNSNSEWVECSLFLKNSDGESIEETTIQIPPESKVKGTFPELFDTVHSDVSWGFIKTTKPVFILELFGSNNHGVCGYPLPMTKTSHCILPLLSHDNIDWNGIAITNTNDSSAAVTLQIFNQQGIMLRSKNIDIPSGHKLKSTITELFPHYEVQKADHLDITCDKEILVVDVSGSNDYSVMVSAGISDYK